MKENIKNIEAFKTLIKRYESITIGEINNCEVEHAFGYGHDYAKKLTGFGCVKTCSLCVVAKVHKQTYLDRSCGDCVWTRTLKNCGFFVVATMIIKGLMMQ